jgi:iron complex transport system substrate-binding protein
MKMTRTPVALLALAVLVAACTGDAAEGDGAAAEGPLVVESCGIEWTYEQTPERALAVDTNALEIMLALGLEDRLVGYFGNPDYLGGEFGAMAEAAAVENLGSSFPYPSLEAVLAPDPDFVFSYGYNPEAGFTPEAMSDAGINNYAFEETCIGFDGEVTIDSVFQNIRDIGAIFGVEDKATEVIEGYEARLAAVAERIPDGAEAPRVFLMDFGEDTIFTAAKGAIPTDIFARAGGENIFADTTGDDIAGTAWMNATFEQIVERDPEVIVIVNYGFGEPEERQAFAEGHPALSGVAGVQNAEYVVVNFPQIVPSPENIDAVELIAEALWG